MNKDSNVNHYATIGNVGKFSGPTQEQQNKKENEIVKMKEVW